MWPYDAVLDRKSKPWTVHLLSEWWLSCNYRRKAEWAVQYVTSVTGRDISLANAAKAVALVAASAAASADAADHVEVEAVEAAFSDAVVSLHPFLLIALEHLIAILITTNWLVDAWPWESQVEPWSCQSAPATTDVFPQQQKKKNRIQIDLA